MTDQTNAEQADTEFLWQFSSANPKVDLLELIKSQNPILAKYIDLDNITFGTPVAITPAENNKWKNTSIRIDAKENNKAGGSVTIFYDRMPIGGVLSDKSAVSNGSVLNCFINLGADKDNKNKASFIGKRKDIYNSTISKFPVHGIYTENELFNPDKYPLDFNIADSFTKDSVTTVTVADTSLRYLPKSSFTITPIIQDPSLINLFEANTVFPFTNPLKGPLLNNFNISHTEYGIEHYKAGKSHRSCLEYGIDVSLVIDKIDVHDSYTGRYWSDWFGMSKCLTINNAINSVIKYQNMPAFNCIYMDSTSRSVKCNLTSAPFNTYGLPIKDGYDKYEYIIYSNSGTITSEIAGTFNWFDAEINDNAHLSNMIVSTYNLNGMRLQYYVKKSN